MRILLVDNPENIINDIKNILKDKYNCHDIDETNDLLKVIKLVLVIIVTDTSFLNKH